MLGVGTIASGKVGPWICRLQIVCAVKSCVWTLATVNRLVRAEGKTMVDENLAREAISLLGMAAAMLIEDAHDALVVRPADAAAAVALAIMLERLGVDLQALGAAAAVVARSKS